MTDHERAEWLARAVDRMLHGITQDDANGTLDEESSDLLEIARLRRESGESARELAREHEESVWKSLLTRVRGHESAAEAGVASLRGSKRAAPRLEAREAGWTHTMLRQDKLETAAPAPRPYPATGDPEFDSLVRAALGGVTATDTNATGSPRSGDDQSVLRLITPRFLALAAGAALVMAAIGPLPATGFAEHPAVQAAEYVARRAGVFEAASLPAAEGADAVIGGTSASPDEASQMLGLTVGIPAAAPGGFTLSSSIYFDEPITAADGGVYALVYRDDSEAFFAIYQEADTGAGLVAGEGSASDTAVAGHPAAYFEGQWRSDGGVSVWDATAGQTLTFAVNGVRVIVSYAGPHISAAALVTLAESLRYD